MKILATLLVFSKAPVPSTFVMEEGRTFFLAQLHYVTACQIIYMYFLDFNLVTLLLHFVQLLVIYHGSKHHTPRQGVTSFQKSIFVCIVLFSNLPVILLHIFYQKTSLITLNFVGTTELAQLQTLLMNDLLIILLESCMVLHRKLILVCG